MIVFLFLLVLRFLLCGRERTHERIKRRRENQLLVIAVWLAVQSVEHIRYFARLKVSFADLYGMQDSHMGTIRW